MANYLVKEESLISIADTIREKTGETTELAFPEDFIRLVSNLTGKGFENVISIIIPKGRARGDINGDGTITQEDVDMLQAHVDGTTLITDEIALWCADINADGAITQTDVDELAKYIANTNPAYSNTSILSTNRLMADYYNNWESLFQSPHLKMPFYYKIPIDGMTTSSKALLVVSKHPSNLFSLATSCIDGYLQINSSFYPFIEETEAFLIYDLEGSVTWEDICPVSVSVASGTGLITAKSGNKTKTIQLTTQAATTITPTTSEQTAVAKSRYTTGAVKVAGDNNLIAENIKNGVSIFGVEGNYEASASTVNFPNGTEWTQSNITSGEFHAEAIRNADGIWVAGSCSNQGIYYSTDGMTWTQSNITSGDFNVIYNANGIWLAGGGSNQGIYYSTDGMTWTQSNINDLSINALHNANGVWVCSIDNMGFGYSYDGINWTPANISGGTFYSFNYANGIWITCQADGNGNSYYSTDGSIWTQTDTRAAYWVPCYNANGVWVAGSAIDEGLFYSYDGVEWTQSNITSGSFILPKSICYANGIWVAGSDTNLYCSTDGVTWQTLGTGSFEAVCNANGVWLANNLDSGFLYSRDGIQWTGIPNTEGLELQTACNANGVWVIGGYSMYSTDGTSWSPTNIIDVGDFYAVQNANGIWVAGGYGLNDGSTPGLWYSISWKPTTT